MKNKHSISTELNQLVHQAKRVFQRQQIKKNVASLLLGIGIFFIGLLALILLEHIFFLSPFLKTISWILAIGAGITMGYLHHKKQGFYNFSDFYSQYAESTSQPGLKYAFDLKEQPRNKESRFFSLALQKNLNDVERSTFSKKLNQYVQTRSEHKQFVSFALLTGVFFSVVMGAILLYQSSFTRTVNFWETYIPPNPYNFQIAPGSVTLEQGNEFLPAIQFEGGTPDKLTLAIKTEVENAFRRRSPNKIDGNRYQFAAISLNTDATYYFEMDGYRSKTFEANMQLRPRFEMLSVEVNPPAYTRLDSSSYMYPFSKISAYPGSQITIKGQTNKKAEPVFVFQKKSGDTLRMKSPNKRIFQYQWMFSQTDSIKFSMQDEAGLQNKNAFAFVLESIRDEYPFVQFLSPTQNVEEKNPTSLLLEYEAGDDFGITSTRLHYKIQSAFGDQDVEEKTVKLPSSQSNNSAEYSWNLQKLDLKPRDVLTFWVEVTDNDRINGPKSGSTSKFTLSVPSVAEYLDEVDKKEQDIDKSLDEVSDSYQQMQDEYEKFKDQLKRNPEQNYEQQQKLKEVQDQQKEVQKKVDELNKKFEEMKSEIERDSVMSKETTQAYQELEKLMKEINDPELQKALEKLQKSMGNLNPEQLRKAMENFEFNEQRYKERIERTVELFKKLKLNSDLGKIATAFEQLAKQEQEVAEGEDDAKTQAQKQEAIREDAQKMQNKLDSLSTNTPENLQKQIEKLEKEATGELNSADQKMEENIQQLKKNSGSGSEKNIKRQQKEIEQQFRQLSKKMNSAKQSMNQQQLQVNVRALQYILYSLLNLSNHQEDLTQETENLTNRSQGFVEKARREQNIQKQFKSLSDSLFAVSSEIPRFSNAINQKKAEVQQQLARSVEQLAERNKSNATFNQRQTLGGMNELASMIASLLKQIQNTKGGAGGGSMSTQQMMEQIQKMSGQQQKLNQQMQNFINDIQGNRLSNDQIERLNQMARQQNEIRKHLRELQQNGTLKDGDRVLSELERMAEQMEDTINDLRGGQTNDLLIERQKNILSRMLNAEQALQERGKEDKREGTTAEETPTAVPPDITLEELQKRIRNLLNDPEQTPYNADYQKLIEQYFKLLQELDQIRN